MADPQPGQAFQFEADNPLGNGPQGLQPGTLVKVREVVPADEPGAHDDSEDAVVIEWTEKVAGIGDDGEPALVDQPRAISIGLSEFPDSEAYSFTPAEMSDAEAGEIADDLVNRAALR